MDESALNFIGKITDNFRVSHINRTFVSDTQARSKQRVMGAKILCDLLVALPEL